MFFGMVYKSGQIFLPFVTIHACDGQTDWQTDKILIARPRLHYKLMQRCKNGELKLIETQCTSSCVVLTTMCTFLSRHEVVKSVFF